MEEGRGSGKAWGWVLKKMEIDEVQWANSIDCGFLDGVMLFLNGWCCYWILDV